MRPVEQTPTLSQIKGQDQPIRILRRALESHRLPHAYLFEGPDGVGKRTTAMALAHTIHCQQPEHGDACGVCPACHKVALKQHPGKYDQPDHPTLGHPDLGLVEPDGQFIHIESIRKLQQKLTYKPFESRLKVYIIAEADRMNPQSANCLLKTLEEPPDHSLLILVSANPYQLLPTVRSRCQRLPFNRLSDPQITQLLTQICSLNTVQGGLIAGFAQGSLGRALSLDPQQLLELRENIFSWFKQGKFAPESGTSALAKICTQDAARLQCLVNWLTLIYRDLLAIKHGADLGLLSNADKHAELTQIAARQSYDRLQQQLGGIQGLKAQLQRNVNPQLALETIFINLAQAA